jgi:hypothetical protein
MKKNPPQQMQTPSPLRAMRTLASGVVAAAVLGFSAAGAWAADVAVTAELKGASEVPANNSPGTGKLAGTLNPDTRVLKWTITYDKLTGPVSAGHFHGPAPVGQNAPPAVNFAGKLASPIEGQAELTPEQLKDLQAGKWYVNLHTAANPGGEVRGQAVVGK